MFWLRFGKPLKTIWLPWDSPLAHFACGIPDPAGGIPDPARGIPDPVRSIPDPARGIRDPATFSCFVRVLTRK